MTAPVPSLISDSVYGTVSALLCHFFTVFDVFSVCHTDMFTIVDSFLCCPNSVHINIFHCSTFVTLSLLASTQICCDIPNMANVSREQKLLRFAGACTYTHYHEPEMHPPPSTHAGGGGTAGDEANVLGVCVCSGVTHLGKATQGGPDRYGLSESLFLLCSVTLRLLPHACLSTVCLTLPRAVR